MKKIIDDVDAVVEHLKRKLGATWGEASVPRAQSSSKLVNPPRSVRPWISVRKEAEGDEFEAWVKMHLDSKVPWM